MDKMKKGKKYLLLAVGLIAADLIYGYGMRRTAIERQYFPLPDGFKFAGYHYFAGDIKAKARFQPVIRILKGVYVLNWTTTL